MSVENGNTHGKAEAPTDPLGHQEDKESLSGGSDSLHGGLSGRTEGERVAELVTKLDAETLAEIAARKSVDNEAVVALAMERVTSVDACFSAIRDQVAVANELLLKMNHQAKMIDVAEIAKASEAMKLVRQLPATVGVLAVQRRASDGKCAQLGMTIQQICEVYEVESVDRLHDYIDNLRQQVDRLTIQLEKKEPEKHREERLKTVKAESVFDEIERVVRLAEQNNDREAPVGDADDNEGDKMSWKSMKTNGTSRMPVGNKSEKVKIAMSMKRPNAFTGKLRHDLESYLRYFNLYTDALEMQESSKKLLLEANLPKALQNHWSFLMQENIGFAEMQERLLSLMGATTVHARISKENQLFRLERLHTETYAKYCARAEILAAEAYMDDYAKQQSVLKTVLVGEMERDPERKYLSALMSSLSLSSYTQLKEQVVTLERTWDDAVKAEVNAVAPPIKSKLTSVLEGLRQQNGIDMDVAVMAQTSENEPPAFGPLLRDAISIAGHSVEALFDSGASASVIRADVLIDILKDPNAQSEVINLKTPRGELSAVTGEQLDIGGWVMINIATKGAEVIQAVFAVVNNMNHEAVIGMNVLMNEEGWWHKLSKIRRQVLKPVGESNQRMANEYQRTAGPHGLTEEAFGLLAFRVLVAPSSRVTHTTQTSIAYVNSVITQYLRSLGLSDVLNVL
uniref:PH domain-containing protein n=1 Tax=Panagrellus redivivus TaxID=6233 RepID=A0A7E4URT6_PANRE